MRNLYTASAERRGTTGTERARRPMALGLGFLLLVSIVGVSHSTLAAQGGERQASGIVKFSNLGTDNARKGDSTGGRFQHGNATLGDVDYNNERKGGDSVYRYYGVVSFSDVDYSNERKGGDSVYRHSGVASFGDVDYSNERKGGDSVYRYNGVAISSDVDDSNERKGGDSVYRYNGVATLSVVAFPNPTYGDLQVKILGTHVGAEATCTIKVTNSFGKLVQASGLQSPFGVTDMKIDLRSYASGIYLVTVESGNERVMARVLKQ